MDGYAIWQFLHVVAMFLAVSIFVGQGMLTAAVARSGDVLAIRRVLATSARFSAIGGGLFVAGIGFGFVTALVGDLDLTQTWLLIAYGLTILIVVIGFAYHSPNEAKLKAAAEASPDDRPSDQLQAAVKASSGPINVVDGLAWLGIIYVMVTKPFS